MSVTSFKPRSKKAATNFGARIVAPSNIHKIKADIFSPCAYGGGVNSKTIPEMKVCIIAGGANNQLKNERTDAKLLHKHTILHAPDYVINAGGLIYLYVREILHQRQLTPWVKQIRDTLNTIFEISAIENKLPIDLAKKMASQHLNNSRQN